MGPASPVLTGKETRKSNPRLGAKIPTTMTAFSNMKLTGLLVLGLLCSLASATSQLRKRTDGEGSKLAELRVTAPKSGSYADTFEGMETQRPEGCTCTPEQIKKHLLAAPARKGSILRVPDKCDVPKKSSTT